MRVFLLFVFLIGNVAAQDIYPSKNVRLIAAAAPGGNPDVLARMLAAKLSDAFGKPFVVENIPGAGGVVAAEQVARAAADGHTLMLGDSGAMAINVALNPKLSYNPLKDFTLITALAAVPTVLVINPALPATSLSDFVREAKAKQLAYGSAGNGSVHHLTMAVFLSRAGIDNMLHVPYKGGTALVAGLLGGEVQAGWSGIPNVTSHIKSGKLRVLCISTARRSPSLPNVPTAVELGFSGFDIATVIGLQAPAGLPREIAARLQAAAARALREPDIAERMGNLGMELRENGTEHYARFVREDLERYVGAVKTAGIKSE
ncbi:MAG TPA: tripartite tricarboxylate transporter substrate binding protein [Burkholderiales bacterium]|nr:tripartite tricarboxylate transporter substrate binding protein [Burkholderiales bacterium]